MARNMETSTYLFDTTVLRLRSVFTLLCACASATSCTFYAIGDFARLSCIFCQYELFFVGRLHKNIRFFIRKSYIFLNKI